MLSWVTKEKELPFFIFVLGQFCLYRGGHVALTHIYCGSTPGLHYDITADSSGMSEDIRLALQCSSSGLVFESDPLFEGLSVISTGP